MAVMTESPGARDETVHLRLTWDREVDAGYLHLTDIGPGEAVTQRIVAGPKRGSGEVVLDFDRKGRLLGIEFIGHELLPPGLAAS
jgi:uncharacterized protein YuzE